MKPTYMSRPFNTIDAPVTERPKVKFVYNFFQPNERISDVPPSLARPISALTPRELSTKVPRYNLISWNSVRFDPIRSKEVQEQRDFLLNNSDTITNESSILFDSNIIYFQDFDHLNRIGERFESSARMRGVLSGSSTDIAAKLGDVTSKSSDNDIIQRHLSIASQNRALFIKDGALIEPAHASSADQLAMIINSAYASRSSRLAASSPVASSAAVVRQNSNMMTVSNVQRLSVVPSPRSLPFRTSEMPTVDELELEIYSVSDMPVSSPPVPQRIEHIGYIIEKFEVGAGDTIKKNESFYISSPNVTNFIDARIKYGIQYVYSVRTVCAFYSVTTRNSIDLQLSRFLVASRPSTFTSILTEEHVPPPPPADINFRWDYQRAALQVEWNFPTNPQLDIKKWQVFRRKSVNEPFSIVAQLDFDDSAIKTPSVENVDRSLIKLFKSPVTFFIDPDFNKDSDFIYAVCSCDAHGMTSNYSMQFRVSFDRIKNRLKKTLISASGAAKQYPNTYLQAELSLDSVKSSNSERMRIYFDPEYLRVNDRFGRDTHFLKTDRRGGLYRFTLLNTDRQLQANVDVSINDLRELRLDGSSSESEG